MIITFSGLNGAGKTKISKMLAEHLKYQWWGMGDITRAHAEELGMSIKEEDEWMRDNPDADMKNDLYMQKVAREKKDVVLDGRAAWHMLPESFKVFLTASLDVRAQRSFEGQRYREKYSSVEETKKSIEDRIQILRDRLLKLHGVDVYEPKNFDVVIDTSDLTPDEVLERVLEALPQE